MCKRINSIERNFYGSWLILGRFAHITFFSSFYMEMFFKCTLVCIHPTMINGSDDNRTVFHIKSIRRANIHCKHDAMTNAEYKCEKCTNWLNLIMDALMEKLWKVMHVECGDRYRLQWQCKRMSEYVSIVWKITMCATMCCPTYTYYRIERTKRAE